MAKRGGLGMGLDSLISKKLDKEIAQKALRAKSTLQDAGLTVTQDDQFWVEAKAEAQV